MLKAIWKEVHKAEDSVYKHVRPLDQIVFDLDEEIENEIKKYYPKNKEKAEKMRARLIDILKVTCLKNQKLHSMRENLQFVLDLAWKDDEFKTVYFRKKYFLTENPH